MSNGIKAIKFKWISQYFGRKKIIWIIAGRMIHMPGKTINVPKGKNFRPIQKSPINGPQFEGKFSKRVYSLFSSNFSGNKIALR